MLPYPRGRDACSEAVAHSVGWCDFRRLESCWILEAGESGFAAGCRFQRTDQGRALAPRRVRALDSAAVLVSHFDFVAGVDKYVREFRAGEVHVLGTPVLRLSPMTPGARGVAACAVPFQIFTFSAEFCWIRFELFARVPPQHTDNKR
jgi:hypothetical protein